MKAQLSAFFVEGENMARDDYDAIVFKILVYLYAVFKRKIPFEKLTFKKATKYDEINEQYFNSVLDMMQKEGLIDGVVFVKAWGHDLILASDLEDMAITYNGIHYLKENDKMSKAKTFLLENVELITSLIEKVW